MRSMLGAMTSTLPVLLCGALLHPQSRAQGATQALADCAAIASDSQRLACFDRLSGRAASAAPAPAPAPAPATMPASEPKAATTTAGTPASLSVPSVGGSGTMFDKAWSFSPSSPRYDISLYAPNYFLFGRYTNNLNTAPFEPLVGGSVLAEGTELNSTEAAFQLSFKFRMWSTDDRRWGAWAAYTQQSQWQLYNTSGNASRPFRETNYMPELLLAYKPGQQWGGWQWNLATLAFNHQSNGRSDTLSRSWNRLIAGVGVERDNLAFMARLWWRVPESADSDDNPTIGDYYGWGDLSAIYKWQDQSFAATIRGNPGTGKGAGQFTWTTAPLLGPLRGYVKIFSGYGESLIDYNWNQSTFGIGVSLNDWL